MPVNDPLADMLARIRNAQQNSQTAVDCPASKLKASVLDVLEREGYIRGYSRMDRNGQSEFHIDLKYHEGEPVIRRISRISTPGRRVYSSIKNLPKAYNGLGIAILSTPRGVMSDLEARVQNVGGEVLCKVF
jgi:small subunit ribosomal protein S8